MADRIKLLPDVVANQIAAGEVVEYPSSVVKEMMENAVDAGASVIKVNVRDGGKELIQIIDNGCGLSPVDARLAFDRHATSKISSVEDIYALRTFGFRGEALASIAAVAEVELRTRQADDPIGTLTTIRGGEFAGQDPVAVPQGAQFCVRNLFYNIPARRKFLKKAATLTAQIRAEFQRVALCNPHIAFELYVDDEPVYRLEPASLAARIVDVVGRRIKHNLLEVSVDTSIVRVEGFVGQPSAARRGNNAEQYFFVNGRYFRSPQLYKAVLKAYEKLIPESCAPSYFLYLTIDPDRIDVNVSPRKTEVKFADTDAVWQIILAAVRETLAKSGAVPMMDFDESHGVEIPVMTRGAVYSEPRSRSQEDYNPFRADYLDTEVTEGVAADVDFSGFDAPWDDRTAALAGGAVAAGALSGGATPKTNHPSGGFVNVLLSDDLETIDLPIERKSADFKTIDLRSSDDAFETIPSSADFSVPNEESELEFIPSTGGVTAQPRLIESPEARFEQVTPLGNGYAWALYGERWVVVDLRRARERVLYDDYLQQIGRGAGAIQKLLFPEQLILSEEEYELLDEHSVDFAALGFDLDLQGGGVVEVRGIPSEVIDTTVDQLIYELLQIVALPLDAAEVRRAKIAEVMARSAARNIARMLSHEEAMQLLDRLAQGGNVSFTPAGKRILAEITFDELRAKLG